MVEEALNKVPHKKFYNALSSVQYVVYSVVALVMLDLLRKEVTGEPLYAYISKFFDMIEDARGLSRRLLLTSTSFMEPIATFLGVKRIRQWRKSRTVMP